MWYSILIKKLTEGDGMNMWFPLFVNLKNKKVLVIGGGKVAFKKISKIMEYGANVTIVTEKIEEEKLLQLENVKIVDNKRIEKYTIERENIISRKEITEEEYRKETNNISLNQHLSTLDFIKFKLEWEKEDNEDDETNEYSLKIKPSELSAKNKDYLFADEKMFKKNILFKIIIQRRNFHEFPIPETCPLRRLSSAGHRWYSRGLRRRKKSANAGKSICGANGKN